MENETKQLTEDMVSDFKPNIPVDSILDILKIDNGLYEYKVGSMGIGTKYVQRFGTPGHYVYIYPSKRLQKFSRRIRWAYARFVHRSQRFLNRFKIAYEGQGMHVKPQSWHTAIIDVTKKDGSILQFKVDLKSHGIYSYRSKRGIGGAAVSLGKAKKRGILRYR